jgi:hypothetical protein
MMKQIFIFMVIALFLVGCGGGSSSGSSSGGGTPPSSNVDMTILEPYTVYPGDQIRKTSDSALVRVSHIDFHEESTVVLTEGSATIIRQ